MRRAVEAGGLKGCTEPAVSRGAVERVERAGHERELAVAETRQMGSRQVPADVVVDAHADHGRRVVGLNGTIEGHQAQTTFDRWQQVGEGG
jgi:hypothetical protein